MGFKVVGWRGRSTRCWVAWIEHHRLVSACQVAESVAAIDIKLLLAAALPDVHNHRVVALAQLGLLPTFPS
jgi:hypothetical protein